MLIFGTDEAGYGPNLGPLVVSLTAWEAETEDFAPLAADFRQNRILIGDSKKVYHGGGSLVPLETGVLVPMRFLDQKIVPIAAEKKRIADLVPKFAAAQHKHGVHLRDMQYRQIEPAEFNQLLDQYDSKGSLLSNVTLRLISEQLQTSLLRAEEASPPTNPILILCDKHGGRNDYLDVLTGFFPGAFIQVVAESRENSTYRFVFQEREIEIRFLAKGEAHLPIALASMLSKYRRELAMLLFNDFWRQHLPRLKPTAGYPEDAKRFKEEIAVMQRRLGIADDEIWRKR